MSTLHDSVAEAASDIVEGLKKYHLAAIFGWQDIAQRYRRSKIGAFWLSINMGVLIAAIGLIFGTLFRSPMQDFLPYLCAGLVIWTFMSTTLSEGCLGFISVEGVILQVRMPLFNHIMRLVWRNIIMFAHNIAVFPVVMLVFLHPITWIALLALPGLLLVAMNLLWITLILSVVCTRYRDMTQIVQNALQVVFYLTPIIWKQDNLPAGIGQDLLMLNPFYHLVSIVRSPLLGVYPSALNWVFAVTLMIVGWTAAVLFFGSYRKRIAYWL